MSLAVVDASALTAFYAADDPRRDEVADRAPFTPFNMVRTSVPGPQYPLYLLGHKILHLLPLCSGGRRYGPQLRHPDLRRL